MCTILKISKAEHSIAQSLPSQENMRDQICDMVVSLLNNLLAVEYSGDREMVNKRSLISCNSGKIGSTSYFTFVGKNGFIKKINSGIFAFVAASITISKNYLPHFMIKLQASRYMVL